MQPEESKTAVINIPSVVAVELPEIPSKASEKKEIRRADGTLLPGTVLNPNGFKKGQRHFATLIRDAIEKVADGDDEPADRMIVKTLVRQAKRGDYHAQDLIIDRVDGKAPQTLIMEGDGLSQLTPEQRKKLDELINAKQ